MALGALWGPVVLTLPDLAARQGGCNGEACPVPCSLGCSQSSVPYPMSSSLSPVPLSPGLFPPLQSPSASSGLPPLDTASIRDAVPPLCQCSCPHPFCTCLSIGFCPHLSPSPPAQGGISVTPCPVSPLPVWVHLGGRSGHWAPPRGFVGQWLVSMAPFTPNPAGRKLISSINEPDGGGCSLRFVVLYAKVLD